MTKKNKKLSIIGGIIFVTTVIFFFYAYIPINKYYDSIRDYDAIKELCEENSNAKWETHTYENGITERRCSGVYDLDKWCSKNGGRMLKKPYTGALGHDHTGGFAAISSGCYFSDYPYNIFPK
ncbi:MAG: hypothetical protein H6860_02905 [Rhodospirillales bacterium]|nr:hypothetical protein [Alphaproteobacteria bacterium]MCB9981328.1 hypothetical protein [Rhodospirillales bacterium]